MKIKTKACEACRSVRNVFQCPKCKMLLCIECYQEMRECRLHLRCIHDPDSQFNDYDEDRRE